MPLSKLRAKIALGQIAYATYSTNDVKLIMEITVHSAGRRHSMHKNRYVPNALTSAA
jgi:hypothetical protein